MIDIRLDIVIFVGSAGCSYIIPPNLSIPALNLPIPAAAENRAATVDYSTPPGGPLAIKGETRVPNGNFVVSLLTIFILFCCL